MSESTKSIQEQLDALEAKQAISNPAAIVGNLCRGIGMTFNKARADIEGMAILAAAQGHSLTQGSTPTIPALGVGEGT